MNKKIFSTLTCFVCIIIAQGQINSIWPKQSYFDTIKAQIDSAWLAELHNPVKSRFCGGTLFDLLYQKKIQYSQIQFIIIPEYTYKANSIIDDCDLEQKLYLTRRDLIEFVAYYDTIAYHMYIEKKRIDWGYDSTRHDECFILKKGKLSWELRTARLLQKREFLFLKQTRDAFIVLPSVGYFFYDSGTLMRCCPAIDKKESAHSVLTNSSIIEHIKCAQENLEKTRKDPFEVLHQCN